jgi:antirestriction protein ArdC
MSEKSRFDLHQRLTNPIIAAIERVSAENFRLPWHRSGMSSIQRRNALTKNAYRGINIVGRSSRQACRHSKRRQWWSSTY